MKTFSHEKFFISLMKMEILCFQTEIFCFRMALANMQMIRMHEYAKDMSAKLCTTEQTKRGNFRHHLFYWDFSTVNSLNYKVCNFPVIIQANHKPRELFYITVRFTFDGRHIYSTWHCLLFIFITLVRYF